MWWWCHHHIFSSISCFWGSGVHKKYAVWVLVGWRIKFHIQRALLIEIWVKTQGDMSKIRTQKSSFFLSSSKINQYYFIIFLRRPILDPKIPLMRTGSWKWLRKVIARSSNKANTPLGSSIYHFTAGPVRVHWNSLKPMESWLRNSKSTIGER